METYEIFKDLAIILISAKLCGLLAGKLHAPQVVGEIIAGLLIGPSILGLVQQNELISGMAEIGVVLLMFFAGLQTNLRDLMRTGWKALLIACAGVFVPLAGGYLLHSAYYGFAPGGSSQFYYDSYFRQHYSCLSSGTGLSEIRGRHYHYERCHY